MDSELDKWVRYLDMYYTLVEGGKSTSKLGIILFGGNMDYDNYYYKYNMEDLNTQYVLNKITKDQLIDKLLYNINNNIVR